MKLNAVALFAIRTVVAGIVCLALMQLVGATAIYPPVGEGAGLDPGSMRYQFGVWVESHGSMFLFLTCWPAVVAEAIGFRPSDTWIWCLYFAVAGAGWVFLWQFAVQLFLRFRVRQAKV